eukprot:361620-Chlamydomonas_euryale.AAC.3
MDPWPYYVVCAMLSDMTLFPSQPPSFPPPSFPTPSIPDEHARTPYLEPGLCRLAPALRPVQVLPRHLAPRQRVALPIVTRLAQVVAQRPAAEDGRSAGGGAGRRRHGRVLHVGSGERTARGVRREATRQAGGSSRTAAGSS